jgi:hypothetical protein
MVLGTQVTYWPPPPDMFSGHGEPRQLPAYVRDDGVVVASDVAAGGYLFVGISFVPDPMDQPRSRRIEEVCTITNLRSLDEQHLLVLGEI